MKQLEKYRNGGGSNKSIKSISREYESTFLDGSFQRYGGIERGSGWNLRFANEFVGSLLEGATSNSIIRADVDECLKYAQELLRESANDKNRNNLEYWKDKQNSGKRYVNIDGNNSSSSIYHFVNCTLDAHLSDGTVINLQDYDKESEQYEEIVHEEKMMVHTLERITYLEMCTLFRKINRMTSLNRQEYRNAHPSELSVFVRELANEDRDIWKIVYSDPVVFDRRSHEELLARFLVKIKGDYEVDAKHSNLDAMYEKDNYLSDETKERVKNSLKLFGKISKTHTGAKIGLAKVQALMDLCDYISKNSKYIVKSPSLFLKWFLTTDAKFVAESKKLQEADVSMSYQWFLKNKQNSIHYQRINVLFRESLLADLDFLIGREVIKKSPLVRTNRDRFTKSDALLLWSMQDAKDRNGNDIDILDIYLGKYEVDHVVSIKDGGETVIENAELMTREDNRAKGAKSNQPHFQHQLLEE